MSKTSNNDSRAAWLRDVKQHLADNDGELVYWGEKLVMPKKAAASPVPAPASPPAARPAPKPAAAPVPAPSAVPVKTFPRAAGDKAAQLDHLRHEIIGDCHLCPLGDTRIKLVFGVGNPESKVMFVGEGPGYDEDRKGEPFVGRAGQLLDKILAAIDLDRTKVYIANVAKCHPLVDPTDREKRGNDRPPTPEEMEKCMPFLLEQIRIIRPRIIVTLGNTSTKALLRTAEGITKLRGQLIDLPLGEGEAPVKVLPTFHPAALLRDPNLKKFVWEDMKLLRRLIDAP